MTAKEFIKNQRIYPGLPDPDECNKVEEWMIGFAKYHVEQALEAASICVGEHEGVDFGLKDSYSRENIK